MRSCCSRTGRDARFKFFFFLKKKYEENIEKTKKLYKKEYTYIFCFFLEIKLSYFSYGLQRFTLFATFTSLKALLKQTNLRKICIVALSI